MTRAVSSAREVAVQYYKAVTRLDVEVAARFLADEFVCYAPRGGAITSREIYKTILFDHMSSLTRSTLIAAHGDDESAILYYVNEFENVGAIHTAEYVIVSDGKILSSRVIFDRLDFESRYSV